MTYETVGERGVLRIIAVWIMVRSVVYVVALDERVL